MGKKSKISRRSLLQASMVLPFLGLISGCAKQEPLRLAGHKWPGFELVFLARELGWLEQDLVRLHETSSIAATKQALRNGEVQGAMMALDEALILCSEDMRLKIILVFNISIGADAVLARPGLIDRQTMLGKTLAYENSSTGKLMLHEFMRHYGLSEKELTTFSLSVEKHESAWSREQVDILVTGEPVVSKLKKHGAQQIFTSRQIPDLLYDVLVVTEEAANNYSSTLEHLLKTYFRALQHFRTNPMDSSHRIARRMEMRAEDVMQLYYGLLIPDALANYAYLSEQDRRMVNAAENLSNIMAELDVTINECAMKGSLTNAFIPKELI